MKLSERRKESHSEALSPEKRDRDMIFQMNEVIFRRKVSNPASPSKCEPISKKMFSVVCPIGKGGFGKVWKI